MRRAVRKGRPNRLGSVARFTEVDGLKFASKKEAKRWVELKLLEKAGEIDDVDRQVRFLLIGQYGHIKTPSGRDMAYVADFVYRNVSDGTYVIEDAKGCRTEIYLIKKAIMAAMGLDIKEV